MPSPAVLLDQAMELPPDQRKELAIQILASVDDGPYPPLSKEQFEAELLKRMQEVESGNVETVDAFEALKEARERFRSRSK